MAAAFPGLVTRAFEGVGLRGAPTILSKMAKTPLGRQIATVRLPSGESISFPACDPYWCRYLYAGKPYELDVERLFRHFGKGRVLIDCGANIGYWSVRHKALGFTRAIAIEANSKLIPLLKRNHPDVIHAAVYSKSGEPLMLGRDGAGARIIGLHNGLASKIFRQSWFGRVIESESVEPETGAPVQSLALNDLGITEPCLVKLDVEGCEIPAIEGADRLDAVFVFEDFPTRGAEVTEYVLGKGFDVFAAGKTIERVTDPAQLDRYKIHHAFGPVHLAASKRA